VLINKTFQNSNARAMAPVKNPRTTFKVSRSNHFSFLFFSNFFPPSSSHVVSFYSSIVFCTRLFLFFFLTSHLVLLSLTYCLVIRLHTATGCSCAACTCDLLLWVLLVSKKAANGGDRAFLHGKVFRFCPCGYSRLMLTLHNRTRTTTTRRRKTKE